jgi:hypothetical protein
LTVHEALPAWAVRALESMRRKLGGPKTAAKLRASIATIDRASVGSVRKDTAERLIQALIAQGYSETANPEEVDPCKSP